MNQDKQPEALRLAAYHDGLADTPPSSPEDGYIRRTARELRRQHALIAELVDALRKITCQTTQSGQYFAIQAARAVLSKIEAQQ